MSEVYAKNGEVFSLCPNCPVKMLQIVLVKERARENLWNYVMKCKKCGTIHNKANRHEDIIIDFSTKDDDVINNTFKDPDDGVRYCLDCHEVRCACSEHKYMKKT